jgi:hypothetical protein
MKNQSTRIYKLILLCSLKKTLQQSTSPSKRRNNFFKHKEKSFHIYRHIKIHTYVTDINNLSKKALRIHASTTSELQINQTTFTNSSFCTLWKMLQQKANIIKQEFSLSFQSISRGFYLFFCIITNITGMQEHGGHLPTGIAAPPLWWVTYLLRLCAAAARLLDKSLYKTLFSPVSNAYLCTFYSIEQISPSVVLPTSVSDDYRGGDGWFQIMDDFMGKSFIYFRLWGRLCLFQLIAFVRSFSL